MDPSSVTTHPRPVTSPFFLLAGKSGGYRTTDYQREKSASRRREVVDRATTFTDPPSFIKFNTRYAKYIMSGHRGSSSGRDERSAWYSTTPHTLVRVRAHTRPLILPAPLNKQRINTRPNIDRGH